MTEKTAHTRTLQRWAAPMVEQADVGMMVFEPGSGRILGANGAAARYLGNASHPLTGETIDCFFQPIEFEGTIQSWLIERPASSVSELTGTRPDGSRFPVWASFSALPHEDPPLMALFFHDITTQKAYEESLRQSEERYMLAMRGANDGIWDWDIPAARIFFSTRWKAMLGYDESDIGASPQEWFALVHPEDVRGVRRMVDEARAGSSPHFVHEYRIRRKDGTYAWVLLRGVVVFDESGRARRMAGSQTDVSTQKHSEDQLQYEALHDGLTGLPNRVLFMNRLKQAINRNRRYSDQLFAVLFLDLDRFKIINDSLGHLVGDQLLKDVAERLRKSVRTYDMPSRLPGTTDGKEVVSRLGGDEFAVLLDGLRHPEDAARVAERIQKRIKEPFYLAEHEVFTSASIGIAVCKGDYDRPDALLRDADTAMYRAKSLGKARYALFDNALHQQALNRLKIESDLRRAVDNHEFMLYYQPIASISSGELVAFEALIRWNHPERGILGPPTFMAIAEETGMVARMGVWALGEAARQQRIWQCRGGRNAPKCVNVNMSSKEMMQPSIIQDIKNAIEEADIAPDALNIEITETAIIDNHRSIAQTLEELGQMGVQLSLDDFGTGYSSLSHLSQFPINNVKIDRSFVQAMTPDGKKAEIARVIAQLCHTFGLTVTAEGIETPEQREFLRAVGCDFFQGYLLSPPLSGEDATAFLDQGSDSVA